MSCNVTGMLQLTALLIQQTPVSDIHVKINPGPRHFFRCEVFYFFSFSPSSRRLLSDNDMFALLFLNLASDLIDYQIGGTNQLSKARCFWKLGLGGREIRELTHSLTHSLPKRNVGVND